MQQPTGTVMDRHEHIEQSKRRSDCLRQAQALSAERGHGNRAPPADEEAPDLGYLVLRAKLLRAEPIVHAVAAATIRKQNSARLFVALSRQSKPSQDKNIHHHACVTA